MNRPYTICHILSSLDGKINGSFMSEKVTRALSGEYGRIRTEMNADAWLYGTTTVKEFLNFREPVLEEDAYVPEGDFAAGDETKPYFVALDTKGELSWESGRFANKGRAEAHVIEILTQEAPRSYRAYLRKRGVSYIIAGETELNCEMAMEKLHRLFGIEKLLICGGGAADWTFLQAGMVDELSMVLSSVTDGSTGTASVFSQITESGTGSPVRFELKAVERIGDGGLYLNYLAKNAKEISNMYNQKYVTLNNGVDMPMAGIGTFLLTPDEAEASVISALQSGYRLIDTANAYVNEKAVGRAMKKSGVDRKEIFLETKLWLSFYEQEDAVERTLERLDTDYIDLLLIHQPAGNYVAGYKLMEKAYKEGKVRAIGLSNFTAAQIQEILDICEVKPAVLQTEVHPYFQEQELKAYLAKESMVIQAWYPLGHGDSALLEEPVFSRLAEKYGKSSAQIILRWHIQDGNVVIPGSKNPDHIRDNFALFDFSLDDTEMAEIAALNINKRYYTSTPEMLKAYAEMVPPVDEQK